MSRHEIDPSKYAKRVLIINDTTQLNKPGDFGFLFRKCFVPMEYTFRALSMCMYISKEPPQQLQ